ncbi:MAG TPA: class I SAM-dependent methyltransferase [Candidatus Acidoferrales bacterium]|nr:class I SAM-dependent methyltransferase [Candidatus Acidoferrales bacterium]
MPREHWEEQAQNWAGWARTPDFDAYWKYAPMFFELLPPRGARTLEVGCGEGRVSRDLGARGHRVIGLDTSPTLLKLAREAYPRGRYLRADAAALPFAGESFDLVVAYNSLMDVDDMPGSVREAARVLRPGGALCACVTHPMADAGGFESRAGDAPFVIRGSYLGGRRPFELEVERDGQRSTSRVGPTRWRTISWRWRPPACRSRPSASRPCPEPRSRGTRASSAGAGSPTSFSCALSSKRAYSS